MVYAEDKKTIINEYDLTKGYLKEEIIELPEQPEIKQEGHYETIKEYPNGGKDVKWVIDKEGQEYKPKRSKAITIYIKYTEKEQKIHDANEEIDTLKNWFETEYSHKQEKLLRLIRLNKFTDDGTLPKDALMALDYEAERKRKRIQELEKIVEE